MEPRDRREEAAGACETSRTGETAIDEEATREEAPVTVAMTRGRLVALWAPVVVVVLGVVVSQLPAA